VERLAKYRPQVAIADRGYRGKSRCGETEIVTPKPPKKGATIYLARTQSMTNAQRLAIPLLAGPGPIYLPLYHEAMLVSWAIGAFT
jgi:hypothetical protein